MITMTAIVQLDDAIKDIESIEKAMLATVEQEGKEIEKLFLQTVKHWDKGKFSGFKRTNGVAKNLVYSEVSTTDKIYYFINGGTKERFAIMSGPKDKAGKWVSQTSVRSLVSQQGQGRVVARGRKAVPVSMGKIEARHFDEEIVKERQPKFLRNVEASIIAATKG